MRLINNATLELEYFMDLAQAPPYAILSHTWAQGEVTLQDFMSSDREAVVQLAGYEKIELACFQAAADGLAYTWVDTCCIDKTSSAELSEAINSMYAWYQASAVCYVFLTDLAPGDLIVLDNEPYQGDGCIGDDEGGSEDQQPTPQFAAVRWFTRGWTLQELIAPATVRFFDKTWTFRGTKASLASALSAVTGIQESVLRGHGGLDGIPVARRMSWAAKRKTTRTEDIAYCLLGIFNVNMPMLYGEGTRAFIRLQEEIMRETNDLTLFAWRATEGSNSQQYRGILALSPAEFADAGKIEVGDTSSSDSEFSLSNKGVRFTTITYAEDANPIILLNCNFEGKPAAIYLRQHGAFIYARAWPEKLALREERHLPVSVALKEARREEADLWSDLVALLDGEQPQSDPPDLQEEDRRQWHPMSGLHTIHISKTISPALAASIGSAHRHGIHLRKGFQFSDAFGAPGKPGPNGDHGRALLSVMMLQPSDRWDQMRSIFLTGGGAFTCLIHGTNVDSQYPTSDQLAVGIENGTPWVSFMDPNHPTYKKAMEKGGLGGDLYGVRSIAKEINSQRLGRWLVEITEDVVEGEAMFCVDLSLEPEEPKDTPTINNPVRGGGKKSKKKHKELDGLVSLFEN